MSDDLQLSVDKFTFVVAADRLYATSGIWVKPAGSLVRIGLSDFVQQRSGDIAFADVKAEGTVLDRGQCVASVETIKVNLDIDCPIAGVVIKNNPLMESAPETINLDPYGEGWLCEIEAKNWQEDLKSLLEPAAYFEIMKQEAEKEAGSQ